MFNVFEDMKYIRELYRHSESFKLFTENSGLGMREIRLFNAALLEIGEFSPVTIRFIEVLAENKRFMYIKEISDKYAKLY